MGAVVVRFGKRLPATRWGRRAMAIAALAMVVPVLGFAPRDPANAMPVTASSSAGGIASLRVHHVSLCVADRAAASAWYCGKLGFVAAAGQGGLLERDGVRIRLVETTARGPGGSVAFEVDDTTAVAAALQDRGVCVEYVGTIEASQFSVTDPDGNVVRFLPRDVL